MKINEIFKDKDVTIDNYLTHCGVKDINKFLNPKWEIDNYYDYYNIYSAIEMFNKQYENLHVKYTNKVHDRYIIIDNKNLYHLGASIKDLGKKIFSISESPNELIDELLIRI